MIFYFSGTGNALWTARELNKAFNEPLKSVADELNKSNASFEYKLTPGEKVFFVFPVHSWGPAVLIVRFIQKLTLLHYSKQPVYIVCVCGDNCGYTNKIIRKALQKRSITLTGAYSIQMPNNYILMKGFGTDSKELEKEKLQNAPVLIQQIIDTIKEGTNKTFYIKGKFSFLKSYMVYPFFRKFAIGKNAFYAKDNCIGCGKCVELCPTKTITMVENRPHWHDTCVQCTACIHSCPVQAIEYGKVSVNQGRYHHPEN